MAPEVELSDLLDLTRAAVLAGDLDALAQLYPSVESKLDAGLRGDREGLLRLRAQAERNAALLSAAVKGVSAARRRVQEMTHAAGFSTYDASGRRGELSAGQGLAGRRL